MAPEQISNSSVDCRSDLYSLGVILYELIIGHRPFKGDRLAGTFRAISQDTPIGLGIDGPILVVTIEGVTEAEQMQISSKTVN
jgi:serine/threonine protein kinase